MPKEMLLCPCVLTGKEGQDGASPPFPFPGGEKMEAHFVPSVHLSVLPKSEDVA